MTTPVPLISVVTPSFNQGPYIEATIRSVLQQDYPRWEHIVVDGGSTDGTLDILKRYPHLRWISEKDRGQGDALNKGFRMARGEIIGWLNSDDTYLPGALATASRELDRSRNRFVIIGHCEFIDEEGRPTGIHHPRAYRGRRRLIEIWKGHTIPQPSVFFYKEVLDRCGSVDAQLHFALDYDLFLRFSKTYWFYAVDAVLATYRLHSASKTLELSEEELLRKSVAVSRRYWSAPYSPRHWYYAWSYRAHVSPLRFRANQFWNRAVQSYERGHHVQTAGCLGLALLLFPPLLWRRGRYPAFEFAKRLLGTERVRRMAGLGIHGAPPPAAVDGVIYSDGWVSTYAVVRCHAVGRAAHIAVEGEARLSHFSGAPLFLRVSIADHPLGEYVVRKSGRFLARFSVPDALSASTSFEVRIEPDKTFVPWQLGLNTDRRQLSFILHGVHASAE